MISKRFDACYAKLAELKASLTLNPELDTTDATSNQQLSCTHAGTQYKLYKTGVG